MATRRSITSFKCLTFDCYGTLVDWEQGIYSALAPIYSQLPESHNLRSNRIGLLKEFTRHEGLVQRAHPDYLYQTVLATAFGNLAAELGVSVSEDEKRAFGGGVGDWPVYPDTVEALQRLKRHFKLVILSNVDRDSFGRTLATRLTGVDFDAIYTAEEIGSYKPDLNNFHYLIDHCRTDLGFAKEDIIHTAQSLHHDHVPATQIGLAGAFIDREGLVMGGYLTEYKDKTSFSWHYKTMGEMADAVDAEAAKSA